ncbi:MAG: sulfatase-like hydrolase/transferase [Deltaproteobacteria bacterium]|nr:sulfatase-like hydrolase/transferase [Deltaproteobacteria bacterium]
MLESAGMCRALHPTAIALLFVLVASCGQREVSPSQPPPWQVIDLIVQKPAIDANSPILGGRKPWKRLRTYLGAKEIRDRNRIQPFYFERIPQMAASQISAIEQIVDSRLRWTVDLGKEPFVSFIPLGNQERPLSTFYRVAVRTQEGEETTLYRAQAHQRIPPAPATETVDLSAFSETTIDLIFEIQPPAHAGKFNPRSRSLWGSPAVYSRKSLEKLPAKTSSSAAEPSHNEGLPNVLLIGADTLRADSLGAYGAKPSLTPALDRLASESDVWLNAISCFNVTNPSFVSLMTGLYGKNHGVYDMKTQLPPEHTTLAEAFSQAGYATLGVISARHLRDQGSGLGQGFDQMRVSKGHDAAELAVGHTMSWLQDLEAQNLELQEPEPSEPSGQSAQAPQEKRQPFFAWVHLFDVHTPHTPPSPYSLGFHPEEATGMKPPKRWNLFRSPGPLEFVNHAFGGEKDLYRGELAYLDRQVDRLLDFLSSRGQLDNTIVVFVADHGENLEDHGILYAHHGLWQTTTHVPLMIRWPDALVNPETPRGRRFDGLVQNVDIFPTVLAAAGLPVLEQDGQDLRTLTAENSRGHRAVFSEHAHRWGTRVRTERHSYMVSQGNPYFEDGPYLFDLENDPEELHNLAGTGLPEEAELDRTLKGWLAERRESSPTLPANLSQEDIDRLRALGYL